MAKALQRRRGTTAEHANFTGLEGEFTYNTTEKRIVAHDGATKGGIPMAKKSEVDAIDVGVTSFNGSKGAVTYSAPVSSVNGKTGAVTVDVGVTSVNGQTGAVTVSTTDSSKIPVSGSRGTLAGYETSGTSTTINATSSDANQTGSAITVSNGSSGTSWTKVVRVTAAVSVSLGSSWVWQGGSAPTIAAGGVLVCCWCGDGGIANFVSPS